MTFGPGGGARAAETARPRTGGSSHDQRTCKAECARRLRVDVRQHHAMVAEAITAAGLRRGQSARRAAHRVRRPDQSSTGSTSSSSVARRMRGRSAGQRGVRRRGTRPRRTPMTWALPRVARVGPPTDHHGPRRELRHPGTQPVRRLRRAGHPRQLRGLGIRGDQRFHTVVSGVSGPLAEGRSSGRGDAGRRRSPRPRRRNARCR